VVLDQLGEPDQPFEVIEGDAFGASYVNLAMMKKLHAAWFNSKAA